MKTYTLYELNEFVRRVIALNFTDPVWVTAEIGQAKQVQGHFYLDLLQKEGNTVIAQMQAVVWSTDWRRMKRARSGLTEGGLSEGLEVRLKTRVDFHERFGLKLIVEEIDTSYTLGNLYLARQKLIASLKKSGQLIKNGTLPLPPVLQRLAVISSEAAAGWQDFKNHLKENAYGYQFDVQLFPSAMQGQAVEKEFLTQINLIKAAADRYDCVLILRGGGAKLDLIAFDAPSIAEAIADCPLPVLTGIGHDIDRTVADIVAHTDLKTPTAVADFVIQHNLNFETYLLQCAREMGQMARQRLITEGVMIERYKEVLKSKTQFYLYNRNQLLKEKEQALRLVVPQLLRDNRRTLDQAQRIVDVSRIETVLKRGFTLTLKNGKTLTSADQIAIGDTLETRFKDGSVQSSVDRKNV